MKGVLYALAPAHKAPEFKRCLQISADGNIEREFTIQAGNIDLRAARLRRDVGRDLLSFTLWAAELDAVDTNGKVLWNYPRNGIDNIWVADLDGDGLDEVIINFNAFAGMHVLDHDGKKLWEFQDNGGVGAVDFDGDGASEVIASSRGGAIAVFQGDGTRLRDIPMPSGYESNYRPVRLSEAGRVEGLLLLTKGHDGFAAMKRDGQLAWQLPLSKRVAVNAAELAPGKPWLAVFGVEAPTKNSILVIDTSTGSIIAQMDDHEKGTEIGWLGPKDGSAPLLIRSTDSGINAFRVVRSN